jgi:hypothetical protein
MTPDIVFDETNIEYLLDLFDKEVDEEGYIYDPELDNRVRSDGDPIKASELGVVGYGSEIFIRDEVDSIVDFVEAQHDSDD